MNLEELTAKAKQALATTDGEFNRKVKFDFGDFGKLFIDGEAGTVSNADAEADATLTVNWENFKKIAKGEMNPVMAYMQRKLKVSGDMSVIDQLRGLMTKFA